MKHFIDPQVDCVFKALLGSENNKPVLISFLNSIIKPVRPIATVEILNPYNDREFIGDKLTIVDIKARDEQNRLYQIEIQLALFPHLPARMLYTWSDIYSSQLQEGENYHTLNPVISIWLLTDTLFPESGTAHHLFQVADLNQRKILNDHCALHVLELNKWQTAETLTAEDQWMLFFRDAKHWANLPDTFNLPELRQAMATLKRFSDKERDYHLYQARQNALREQSSQQQWLEEMLKKQEEAQRKQEEERLAKEAALAELERLKVRMKAAGIDPDCE